jgi:signal transduction histidine kinase
MPTIQQMRDNASPDIPADESQPIVTINLDLAEIVGANASGAQAIGLFSYASFPIGLDASTPALARLREIAALGNANGKAIERLTFWSGGRLRPVRCTVARQRSGGSGVFVLRIIDDNSAGAPPAALSSRSDADAHSASQISRAGLSETIHGTADTLKDIARRIRVGDVSARIVKGAKAEASPEPSTANAASSRSEPAQIEQRQPAQEQQPRTPASVLDPDHLAKLAHELKTPLTAIAAAAEIMRDERLGAMGNERYLTYAADIHESATHALDVITTLLSESTKPEAALPRLIALDLNAVVERTVSSIQALAQSRGLTLAFEAERGRPHVVANPTSLRQILLNLLTNAIKFTPRGGDVHVATGYLGDGRVFLAVRDTGCGMNGESVGNAKPADEKTQPWLGSNGIGLPLVQRLIRDMGAEFEIDSAPEKGTVVLIAFGGFARWPE